MTALTNNTIARHIITCCILIASTLSANAEKDGKTLTYATPEQCGFASELEATIDSIVKSSIMSRAFPGCQIIVAKDGKLAIDKAYGTLDYSPGAKAVNRSTLYDIASMTKAIATVSGLMIAYDKGLFQLGDTVSTLLPRLSDTDKKDLTVRDFLFHETGIPATINTYALMVDSTTFSGKLLQFRYMPPYTVKLDKDVFGHRDARLRSDIIHTTRSQDYNIEYAKGLFGGKQMVELTNEAIYNRQTGDKKYIYSCLNFCILKDMEEELTGQPHARWLQKHVFQPIGARHTMFRPTDHNIDTSNIAPTEKDRFMRRQILKGFVHDEIAACLGGIAGNAGLFSTAEDIAKICQTWLNGGIYNGKRVFDESTVELFTTETSDLSGRGLGFDKPSRIKQMKEIGMPVSSYGHTGFTGTCFWVDPENKIIIVILTNRIHPSRDNPAWDRTNPRNAIIKAVYNALTKPTRSSLHENQIDSSDKETKS